MPSGKIVSASAMCAFSTSVLSRLWAVLGVPTGTTRVMSVVPFRYWPPESISRRPSPRILLNASGVAE